MHWQVSQTLGKLNTTGLARLSLVVWSPMNLVRRVWQPMAANVTRAAAARVPCGKLKNMKLTNKQRVFIEEHGRAQSNIRGWQQMRRWVDNLSAIPSVKEIGVHTEAPYSTHDMAGMNETRPWSRGITADSCLPTAADVHDNASEVLVHLISRPVQQETAFVARA